MYISDHTEAAETSAMDQPAPHSPQDVTIPFQCTLNIPLHSASHSVHTNVDSDNLHQ
jgi:hypothetical protein